MYRHGKRTREIARWKCVVYIGGNKGITIDLYEEHNALIIWCGYKFSETSWEDPIPVTLHSNKGSLRLDTVLRGFDFMGLDEKKVATQHILYGV